MLFAERDVDQYSGPQFVAATGRVRLGLGIGGQVRHNAKAKADTRSQSRARQNSIDPLAKDARLNVPISWLCALSATMNAKSKRSLSRVGAWPWAKAQLDGELRRELFSRGRYDL